MRNSSLYHARAPRETGMPTPWGPAQQKQQCFHGVYSVATAGHGGILVGKAVARRQLSAAAQAIGEPFGSYLAYEEDCNWAAVAYEHPEWLVEMYATATGTVEGLREAARETLDRWHPEYFGKPPLPPVQGTLAYARATGDWRGWEDYRDTHA